MPSPGGVAQAEGWGDQPQNWEQIADVLANALRLTQEYLGEETLPNIPGWSHYDAMTVYSAAKREMNGTYIAHSNKNCGCGRCSTRREARAYLGLPANG